MKNIFTLVCHADRRTDRCVADEGTRKSLIHYKDWSEVCISCEHCDIKLTKRGEELDKGWFSGKEHAPTPHRSGNEISYREL